MRRPDGRKANEPRSVHLAKGFFRSCPSSVLIEAGGTRVACAATVEQKAPPFLAGTGRGWVTAEYGMLPGSTSTRKNRNRGKVDGRTSEIERLIGRCLRAVTTLDELGERTIRIDCDVLDADGGTRTASITGAFVALADCVARLKAGGAVSGKVIREPVAAVSVGIVDGKPLLDLAYVEDSAADVDMNVAMTASGEFVEIQGTAESRPFSPDELEALLALAKRGIRKLIRIQKEALR
ncbi:MAG: ribonuclease PH [Planctomycetes bacterium]|nr:ribonuclease PH [Planctomycetota bacterium]